MPPDALFPKTMSASSAGSAVAAPLPRSSRKRLAASRPTACPAPASMPMTGVITGKPPLPSATSTPIVTRPAPKGSTTRPPLTVAPFWSNEASSPSQASRAAAERKRLAAQSAIAPTSLRREAVERQLRDRRAGGNADEPRESLHRAARLPRLRFEKPEHEIEHDVVELIDMRERERDVARRRCAGKLQAAERQSEVRRAAVGRHFERQPDGAKMRLPRNGRRRIDGDVAGEA